MASELTIEKIADLEPINELNDIEKVLSLFAVLKDGNYYGPALLFHDSGYAVTGSHRIYAARLVMCLDEMSRGDRNYANLEIPAIDVTEYVERYCNEEDCTFEQLPFDYLQKIFEGTDLEDEVSENDEW